MLKLKVLDCSLGLLQVYARNAASKYQDFVDEVNNVLLRVSSTESIVLMRDLNVHVETHTDTWKDGIGKYGVTGLIENGRYLLQPGASIPWGSGGSGPPKDMHWRGTKSKGPPPQ